MVIRVVGKNLLPFISSRWQYFQFILHLMPIGTIRNVVSLMINHKIQLDDSRDLVRVLHGKWSYLELLVT